MTGVESSLRDYIVERERDIDKAQTVRDLDIFGEGSSYGLDRMEGGKRATAATSTTGVGCQSASTSILGSYSVCVPIPMIAPVSHSTGPPIETLEQIFLHLPGRDIIRVEAV